MSLLQSVLFRIARTCALVLRRCDIEAVAQGEGDAARVIVLRLAEHHAVEVERSTAYTLVEEVVTRQFDVETPLEEVFTDAE